MLEYAFAEAVVAACIAACGIALIAFGLRALLQSGRRELQGQPCGHGIDSTGLAQKLHWVRRDYVAALALRSHRTNSVRSLGAAQHSVRRRSFFRRQLTVEARYAPESEYRNSGGDVS